MRIGILGLLHESNTFVQTKTGWTEFSSDIVARGPEINERFRNAPHEIGGFFSALARARVESVPLFVARALPSGVIEAGTYKSLLEEMLTSIESAGPLDGLLVAPHGATVSERFPDADGHWLQQIRSRVGPSIPLVGTIDPHANVSTAMVAACDALVAYQTNPHVDQHERGQEAARLLIRTLRGEISLRMAAIMPPLAIGIDCQATDEDPCQRLIALAEEARQSPLILTTSIVLGFPYADVPEMGAAAIVVANGDRDHAKQCAQRIAQGMWEMRSALVSKRIGVAEAIDLALVAKKPVCLLDMGDNVGAGSPADGTWIAHDLLARRVPRSVVVLCDPAVVRAAASIGIGGQARLRVGGRSGPLNGEPLEAEFRVVRLAEGKFTEEQTTHGGFTSFDQGNCAVLTTDFGLTVLVTSNRMVPFSMNQLRSSGIEPDSYQIIVAKGVNAPIAAYRSVCRTFIRVDTPGMTTADMTRLEFAHRRRPMFPFEPNCEWDGGQNGAIGSTSLCF